MNGVAPGVTATEMMRIQDNNVRKNYLPSNRMTTPEEIVETALLMVSDMGRNICGQIIVVDGNLCLYIPNMLYGINTTNFICKIACLGEVFYA